MHSKKNDVCLKKKRVYLFSLLYTHAWYASLCLKEKEKTKRFKILLNMIVSVFLGDVEVIGCTSKVTVSIKRLWLCVSFYDSLVSLFLHDKTIMLTCKSFTHNMQFFTTVDINVQVEYDLVITRNTWISRNLLNCLNSFFRINLIRRV